MTVSPPFAGMVAGFVARFVTAALWPERVPPRASSRASTGQRLRLQRVTAILSVGGERLQIHRAGGVSGIWDPLRAVLGGFRGTKWHKMARFGLFQERESARRRNSLEGRDEVLVGARENSAIPTAHEYLFTPLGLSALQLRPSYKRTLPLARLYGSVSGNLSSLGGQT
jgi:hypothetical protein